MPLKLDPETGRRWVDMEFVATATREELWRVLATGPGYTAWFTRCEIDGRVGGRLQFDFGANGSSSGEVTIWEPPLRFGYVEREWAEGAPPVETEITITARGNGQHLVRMTHSLTAAYDDWDASLEGFEAGWPAFFEVLRLYLAHSAGEPAAFASVMHQTQGEQAPLWRALLDGLQIAHADVGEHAELPFAAPEGLVEFVRQDMRQRYLLVRTPVPDPQIVLLGTFSQAGTTNASVAHYCYGRDAQAAAASAQRHWQEWFARRFPTSDGRAQ
ncbi:MAG TPA: SRPBCC domain-containing protein [Tahibacter sp.]|uniref:SRPBCC family protein n=1 Tax=Tahibacter sp. TaxID=2056211 RepID=UPI002B7A70C3|nr:SRPBCC domain-containing protein [Tahibacter sp.]HSX60860.1 SRPBCC domain-containing protein [Tahibacter sp.]